jgi:hypothetical protein
MVVGPWYVKNPDYFGRQINHSKYVFVRRWGAFLSIIRTLVGLSESWTGWY